MKLYIVRHGETEWNKARRIQGQVDIPLNEFGRRLARKTAKGLSDITFDLCYSSPLSRARETAALLLEGRDTPVIEDARISEMAFGEYEGRCCSRSGWNLPEEFRRFFDGPDKYQAPAGGENFAQVKERTGEFLKELYGRTEYQDSNILIATHDGMAVCFDENDVRPMGRDAVGVRGIRLREGDYVVGAARAIEGKTVLSITEKGFGKRTPVEEYRITNRGGLGIRNYMVTEKTGPIVGVKVVDGSEDLLLVTQAGILIRTHGDSIRMAGRSTQGVIVMRFKEDGDKVISLALADREETGDQEAESSENAAPVEE